MKASIQNFRAVANAEIDIAPVALVTGRNGAGKTSIALAIAAAVTGRAVPFDDVTKKDCKIMLREGTRTGMVSVTTDAGITTVEWPKADVQSDGAPPSCSPIAAGLASLISMKKKDSLTYLINLLKADVSKNDFIQAFEEKGISPATAEKVWMTIEAQGWEAGHARAKETGTKLKGVWEQATGEKYGSKKAEEWVPMQWEEDLGQETVESLQAILDAARQEFEKAIAKNAVSQAERDTLKAQADSTATLEAQKAEAQDVLTAAERQLKKIEDELRANPDAKAEYSCPHCDGKIHINAVSGNQLVLTKAGKIDQNALKEARAKNAKLCGEQQNISQKVSESRRKLQSISQDLDNANRAKQKLGQLGDAPHEGDTDLMAAARAAVTKADTRLKTFEAHQNAKKTARHIADNQVIIDLLDETGLRQSKLTECLYAFRTSYTDPICQTFGIPQLILDADLNMSLGKMPYVMLSESEKFRVKVVLQVAIARIENASLIIIDGADILDQGGRGNLLQVTLKSGIPALICMTLSKPDMAPNLAQANVGTSYWVANGECAPFSLSPAASVSERQPDPAAEKSQGFFRNLQDKEQAKPASPT